MTYLYRVSYIPECFQVMLSLVITVPRGAITPPTQMFHMCSLCLHHNLSTIFLLNLPIPSTTFPNLPRCASLLPRGIRECSLSAVSICSRFWFVFFFFGN